MSRYIDRLITNHQLESSDDRYTLSEPRPQFGGVLVDKMNPKLEPNGGFPPLVIVSKEEAEKKSVKREYTSQQNVVKISDLLHKRRSEPSLFGPSDEDEAGVSNSPPSASSLSFNSE